MANNPNPARITAAMWWLMEQLLALQPGTENGGIYANKSGYHNTRAANASGNYSVRDAEDKAGPNDKAAAFDWTFKNAQGGNYSTIAHYMQLILASGKDKNDPRLDGWREFYGQANADSHVEGWDCRYLHDITSDSSHLWHIHGSEDRGMVESYENKRALLSVLRGESVAQWRASTGQPTPPTPAPKPLGHAPGTRVLKLVNPQMSGDDVRYVQRFIGPGRAGAADGMYGPRTQSGVRWYQQMRGISVDGEVGPQTFAQMGVSWVG